MKTKIHKTLYGSKTDKYKSRVTNSMAYETRRFKAAFSFDKIRRREKGRYNTNTTIRES